MLHAARFFRLVEVNAEGAAHKVRKARGKLVACRGYAYLLCRKAVRIQQNTIGLGNGAAFALDPRLTQLCFYFLREGFFHLLIHVAVYAHDRHSEAL